MSDQIQTPPEQSPEQPQSGSKPPPTDWRLIAIVAVAVIFLAAVFINKQFYSKKKISPTTTTTQPAGAAPVGEPAPKLSMAEEYAGMIRDCEVGASGAIYKLGDRDVILGRPPTDVPGDRGARKRQNYARGRLIDVTRRVDGLRPEMLFRRSIFGADVAIFMDFFPPLGLTPEPKMIFKQTSEVTMDVLADQQRVVGVVVGGEARAYPIKMMNYHEVINDTVGGVPIVLTWSALVQSATAWERTMPDKSAAVFGSSGMIYQSAVVMYDKDTVSLWWSTLGRPLTGAHTGGPELTPVQATVASWKSWKEFAPNTTVLVSTDPPLPINYDMNPAAPKGYFNTGNIVYPVYGLDIEKNIIPLKEYVYVVVGPDGKSAKVYVEGLLVAKAVEQIEDTIGEAKVSLKFDKNAIMFTANSADGKPLLVRRMFWLACAGTWPNAELWEKEAIMRHAEAALAAAAGEQPSAAAAEPAPLPAH